MVCKRLWYKKHVHIYGDCEQFQLLSIEPNDQAAEKYVVAKLSCNLPPSLVDHWDTFSSRAPPSSYLNPKNKMKEERYSMVGLGPPTLHPKRIRKKRTLKEEQEETKKPTQILMDEIDPNSPFKVRIIFPQNRHHLHSWGRKIGRVLSLIIKETLPYLLSYELWDIRDIKEVVHNFNQGSFLQGGIATLPSKTTPNIDQ